MNLNFRPAPHPARQPGRRVALISEHASPLGVIGGVDGGGQNVYVARVAEHLAREGHEVDVFTRRDEPSVPAVVDTPEGYRVVHVDAGPAEFVRKEELLRYMPEFTEQVCQFFASHGGYDIVHANFWMSGMTARELKRRFDVPFVITFHALGKVRRAFQGAQDEFSDDRFAIEEALVQDADRVIAECPQDEVDLVRLYGADPSRLTMIPCGYDASECAPVDRREAREHLGLPVDAKIALQLGRLVPRKGVDNVIRAFSRVRGELPDAMLVVAGGDTEVPDPEATPEIGRLSQVVREEGVEDAVRFVGRRPRSELRYWYSAADVFVTTPWYEPFGITPVEAMACGTPVVGARVGGIQYTVVDGETGLLVEPDAPDELGVAIARVLKDEAWSRQLGENGRARAKRHFTWHRVASSIASLYETVVAEATRADATQPAAGDEHRLIVRQGFDALLETLLAARDGHTDDVLAMARTLASGFAQGRKLLVCGNGGSAADAQHLAGELVARFHSEERRALPAIVLGAEVSSLTAWANDVGYETALKRQVEAFGTPGDVLLGLSTSGRSRNIVRAFEAARRRGMTTLALLGGDGGDLLPLSDASIVVPSADTQRIQEVHGLLIHLLCELVEQHLAVIEQSPFAEAAS